MSNGVDIVGFVKDPSQLAELCRDVIDQLDASSEGVAVAAKQTSCRSQSLRC